MDIDYQGVNLAVLEDGEIYLNGKKRNHFLNADGYPCISLDIPSVGWRAVGVHRLIASAFIPNPNRLPEVNHKDYNRKNFEISNLEWITHADNVRYSQCNRDTTGEKNPNFGNHTLHEKYAAHPELAKEKQGRPGTQNGRCRRISMFKDGRLVETFPYIKGCAQYLQETIPINLQVESICNHVRSSAKSGKLYNGFTFSFEDERFNDYPVREYGSCENPEPEVRST